MAERPFEDDLELTFQGLRQSLIELFGSIGVDDVKPYPVAQQLGVNKNLTWKASRIIQATDPWAAIRYLPGPTGMKTLLDAFGTGQSRSRSARWRASAGRSAGPGRLRHPNGSLLARCARRAAARTGDRRHDPLAAGVRVAVAASPVP